MDRKGVIQGLWIGKSLSVMEQLSITSFIKNGHEYHLYVYEDVKDIPQETIIKDADEIIPEEDIIKYKYRGRYSYTGSADVFRYKLLFEKGGYWADTDTVCLRPFDFQSDYVFGEERDDDGSMKVAIGVIKAPAGSEFMQFCYNVCLQKNPYNLTWGEIGNKLIDKAINKFELTSCILPYKTFYPISWWNWTDILNPWVEIKIETTEIYAVHLWNEMWRMNKADKNGIYHPLCLYEKLKKLYL
jgi:hypothetical protein